MADKKLNVIITAKDKASKVFNKNEKSLNKLGKTAKMAGLAIGGMVAAMGIVAIKKAAGFEERLANVATLLDDDVIPTMDRYKDGIFEIGKKTSTSLNELAEGLFFVQSATIFAGKEIKSLNASNELAVAGNTSLETSILGVAALMKGYGEETVNATRAGEFLFQINKKGLTTFGEIANAIPKATTMANLLGISQAELAAGMATLAGTTGNADEVATQLNATYRAFVKPSKAMSAALEEIGFKSGFAAVKVLGFEGTLQKLREETGNTDEGFVKLFNNVRAIKAVIPLAGKLAGKFSDDLEEMANSAGVVTEAVKIQEKAFNKQYKTLKNNLDIILIKIGTVTLPLLKDGIEELVPVIDRASDGFEEFAKMAGDSMDETWNLVEDTIAKILVEFNWLGVEMGKEGDVAGINFMEALAHGIFSFISSPIDTFKLGIKGLADEWLEIQKKALEWGANLMKELGRGMLEAAWIPIQAVQDLATGIEDYIGFSSPTRKGAGANSDQWAPALIRMFAQGVKDTTPEVESAFKDLVDGVEGKMNDIDDIFKEHHKIINQTKDKMRELAEDYTKNVEKIKEQLEGIVSKMNDLDKKEFEIGQNRNQQFADQIVQQKELIEGIDEQIRKQEEVLMKQKSGLAEMKEEDQKEAQEKIKTEEEKLQALNNRLGKERTALVGQADLQMTLSNEIKEIEDFNNLTTFEQKFQLIEDEYNARQEDIKKEKGQLQKKMDNLRDHLATEQEEYKNHFVGLENQRNKDVERFKNYLQLRKMAWERHLSSMRGNLEGSFAGAETGEVSRGSTGGRGASKASGIIININTMIGEEEYAEKIGNLIVERLLNHTAVVQ